jgi:hypothetical protein
VDLAQLVLNKTMKLLRDLPSENLEDSFFRICIQSKSGCNIRVLNKNYNIYLNNDGKYIVSEFIPDFELTEDEFKKLTS